MVWVVTVIDSSTLTEVYRKEFPESKIPNAEEQAARHLRVMVKRQWTAEYAVRLERSPLTSPKHPAESKIAGKHERGSGV